MLCGDTSVTAPDLRKRICQLDASDPETGKTGFQKHLEVISNLLSSRFSDVIVFVLLLVCLASQQSESWETSIFLQWWYEG